MMSDEDGRLDVDGNVLHLRSELGIKKNDAVVALLVDGSCFLFGGRRNYNFRQYTLGPPHNKNNRAKTIRTSIIQRKKLDIGIIPNSSNRI